MVGGSLSRVARGGKRRRRKVEVEVGMGMRTTAGG